MKLGLKITSVAFALALLTACGGGGGGGGGTGGGPTGPTGPTTGDFELPTGVKLNPVNNPGGTNSQYVTQAPAGVVVPDVPSDVTYDVDLPANREDGSSEYPGFTVYKGTAGVDTNDDDTPDVMVQVYGIQYGDASNKTEGTAPNQTTRGNSSAVMVFDSSGGVAAGGALMTNMPSGELTYKGYNFFRYTTNAQGQQQSLQTGKFTLTANFGDGTGMITTSETSSSVGTGTTTTTYAGTRITNQPLTIFTQGNDAGSFQGDIKIVPTTREGTTTTPGTELSAKIAGKFHGDGAVGVSGTYHDTASTRMFQGAIAGDVGAPAN